MNAEHAAGLVLDEAERWLDEPGELTKARRARVAAAHAALEVPADAS